MDASRISAARRVLEDVAAPTLVTGCCGFTDIDTFRRAFQRRVGVTPSAYRRMHTARAGS